MSSKRVPLNDILVKLDESINPFIYRPSIVDNDDFVKSMVYSTKDKASFSFHHKHFTVSDLFIVMGAAKLHLADMQSLEAFISWHKSKFSDISTIPSPDMVKQRMVQLTRNGLMNRFILNLNNGREYESSYYTASNLGFSITRSILKYRGGYDDMVSFEGADDVVKQLGVNSILMHFMEYDTLVDFSCNKQSYDKENGKHRFFAYAKTLVNDVENVILIEPIHYRFDDKRINSQIALKELKERLSFIENKTKEIEASGKKVKVIFSCENREGLTRAMQRIAKLHNYLVDRAFFTTSSIVHTYGFDNALIYIHELGENNEVISCDNKKTEPFY